MWRTYLAGFAVASVLAAAPRALVVANRKPVPAQKAPPARLVAEAPPVLTVSRLTIDPDRVPAVVLTGAGFAEGLRVTLRNPFYVVMFSGRSIEALTTTSLQFDGSSLAEGTYDVTVTAASGASSNAITLVVRRSR